MKIVEWRCGIAEAPIDGYFHGDTGAGPGASNKTGCSGGTASLIQFSTALDPRTFLDAGEGGDDTRSSSGKEKK